MFKEIEIAGDTYELDLDKALCEGYLRKKKKPITAFTGGDMFKFSHDKYAIIIPMYAWGNYKLLGIWNKCEMYSDTEKDYHSMLAYLNDVSLNFEYIRNINEEFAKLLTDKKDD